MIPFNEMPKVGKSVEGQSRWVVTGAGERMGNGEVVGHGWKVWDFFLGE